MIGILFSSRTSWHIDFDSPVSVVKLDCGTPMRSGLRITALRNQNRGESDGGWARRSSWTQLWLSFLWLNNPIIFHLNAPVPAAGMMRAQHPHTVQALGRGSPRMPMWWWSRDQTTAPRKGDSKGQNGWLNRPFSHWLQSRIWSYLENWEICLYKLHLQDSDTSNVCLVTVLIVS